MSIGVRNPLRGGVRKRGDSWHGRFWIEKKEHSCRLGLVAEMSEGEARASLRRIIEEHCAQRTISTRLKGQAPLRLQSDSKTVLVAKQSDARHNMRVGVAGEMLVAADLLRRDFEVFKPYNPYCEFDLLAIDEERMFRIEVKTADESRATAVARIDRNIGKFDLLAMVFSDGSITYLAHSTAGSELNIKNGKVRVGRSTGTGPIPDATGQE